jgi:iron complex transport system substrate-binding protein
MKRSLLLLAMLLATAACGPGTGDGQEAPATLETTTTTSPRATTTTAPEVTTTAQTSDFPVTVEGDNGAVTIQERPDAIISLSPVSTEMLFAVGAGDQVVAVDDQSNYPTEAPMTDLSGFTPNVEAILAHEPDLVFISYDPGDLAASLDAAGVPVLSYGSASTLDDTYRQIEAIGTATGHAGEASLLNEQIANDLEAIVADAPDLPEGTDYYHEVDNTFYSATSMTFIGRIYGLFGLENIADAADEDGSAFGFPQLSSEYIVSEDPDIVFLGNTLYGESTETVSARPGWSALTAVQEGHVYELDSDIVSRWGPRVVDFAGAVSDALEAYVSEG